MPRRAATLAACAAVAIVGLVSSVAGHRAAADDLPPPTTTDPGMTVAERVLIADPGVLVVATRGVATPVVHVFPLTQLWVRYSRSHHDYPATDIAVPCGSAVLSAVDGVVWEVERTDRWNPFIDAPGTRGGRTVVIDGDDGVRYLFAHLSSIRSTLTVGDKVRAAEVLGASGSSGRSTVCHVHLGISPICPTRIWSLLAGTLWPWRYLDAWKAGANLSPRGELDQWLAAHPRACSGSVVIAPAAGSDTGDYPVPPRS